MSTLVIGAGAAGLCCAFELQRRGHAALLVEARDRIGGRCLTIRRGTRLVEDGHPDQICSFSEGLYFNPGPARIPQHHITVEYCRELGVALEPFLNRNYRALLHSEQGSFAGKPTPIRDVDFDLRGLTFALLYRALHTGVVGADLDGQARQRLLDYIAGYASVRSSDGVYTGDDRRTPGESPSSLVTMLASGFAWKLGFFEEYDLQATMLQIVGGTDRLTDAFAERLDVPIHLGATVREIIVSDTGVSVAVEDSSGCLTAISAECCVVTLPLPVLASIDTNLSSAFKDAVAGASYESAVKVGIETPDRWWETELSLYGGMSFTDLPSTQCWYPSSGFGSGPGVLLGAYNFGAHGGAYSDMPPAQRISSVTKDLEAVHRREVEVRSGVSVAWRNNPWARGAYAYEDHRENETLAKPHSRLRLAGEHMSAKHGWIAGALESGMEAAVWASES